jgi:nucleoid-associated protein YgaU
LRTTDRLVSVVPPAPETGQDLRYTVQSGENLWGIAFNYYGCSQPATINRILAANRGVIPSGGAVRAGQVITLPARGLRQPVHQAGLTNAAGMYLVQRGDTLGSIAAHFYGDASLWTRIREANRTRVTMVGSTPMIYGGQWLIIPSL